MNTVEYGFVTLSVFLVVVPKEKKVSIAVKDKRKQNYKGKVCKSFRHV